jgi:hypothetical protein
MHSGHVDPRRLFAFANHRNEVDAAEALHIRDCPECLERYFSFAASIPIDERREKARILNFFSTPAQRAKSGNN